LSDEVEGALSDQFEDAVCRKVRIAGLRTHAVVTGIRNSGAGDRMPTKFATTPPEERRLERRTRSSVETGKKRGPQGRAAKQGRKRKAGVVIKGN
jgi:hypothetical protein